MDAQNKTWNINQLETSSDECHWTDVLPDVPTLRYVRVKPAEFAKWNRRMMDENREISGHNITII